MSAVAKENYAFIQNHLAYPIESFRLNEEGRLVLLSRAQRISQYIRPFFGQEALQPEVAAACFRAKVWGHLIPEIRDLKNKEDFTEADLQRMGSLLGEAVQLRKENPFSNPRFQDLLDTLEASLVHFGAKSPGLPPEEGLPLPWKKIAIYSASASAAAYCVLHPKALVKVFKHQIMQWVLIRTAQTASLALTALAAKKSAQASKDRFVAKKWEVISFLGFAGFFLPFFVE